MPTDRIPDGTGVCWRARPNTDAHAGVVIAFVPAGADVHDVLPHLRDCCPSFHLRDFMGICRYDRYIVQVERGQHLVPRFYAPRAKTLEAQHRHP